MKYDIKNVGSMFHLVGGKEATLFIYLMTCVLDLIHAPFIPGTAPVLSHSAQQPLDINSSSSGFPVSISTTLTSLT